MECSCLTLLGLWQAAPADSFHRAKRMQEWLARAAIVLLLGGLPSLAAAATLYVDQNDTQCNDAGPGSQQEPFCTIGAAADQVSAGDTVVVRSGTYNEEVEISASGTAGAPIVFTADNGVTVTGQKRGFDVSGSWISIEGFTISNTTSEGIRAQYTSNITIADNQVINAGDSGIEVRSCGDITIANNEVQGSTADGILSKYCTDLTVHDNHVFDSGQPVSGQTKKGIYLNGSTDSVVSDNLTEANSDHGIYVSASSSGLLIARNTTRENARGYTRAAAGIEVTGSSGNTIEANISYDNEDSGINVKNGSPDNLVVNNLSYNNGDHGIDFLRAPDGRIIGNTAYSNVRRGLQMEGESTGMTVSNNICVDNGASNIRSDAGSTAGSTANYNIVYLTGSGTMYIWGNVSYKTLAAAQAANPGLESNGLETDPLWVAPGSGDFHLSAGSPAIDSANSGVSGALSHDLEGNNRVDDPGTPNTGVGPRPYDDRGAFEH